MELNLKGNILIVICFTLSVTGLLLIYVAALNIKPMEMKISEINFELIGRSVTTSGNIIYKKEHTAGHLFLTISDGKSNIQVPLFAGFMTSLNSNGINSNDFKVGRTISVSGLIDEYQGSLQIIPRKPEDIKLLGD